MCLGVPAKVIRIKGNTAVVEVWGIAIDVRIDALEEHVVPGDFIIEHDGCAVRRVAPEDVADTLASYELMLAEEGEYPCKRVADEIEVEIEARDLYLV